METITDVSHLVAALKSETHLLKWQVAGIQNLTDQHCHNDFATSIREKEITIIYDSNK